MKEGKEPIFPKLKLRRLPAVAANSQCYGRRMRKKIISQIPGVAKVIFEIRQPLHQAPIGFILEPKDFENRQFGVKSPHLVTLDTKADNLDSFKIKQTV